MPHPAPNTPPNQPPALEDPARSKDWIPDDIRDALQGLHRATARLRRVRPESWIVFALVVILLVSWEWIASQFPQAIIPSILETADGLFGMLRDYRQDYIRAVGSTLQVYYVGLALALILGWVLAGLAGLVPLLGRVLKVVLDFLNNIPLIAFMPLFVALLGLGPSAKIVVVTLAALLVITTTAQAAFESADKGAEEAALLLGASRLQAQVLVVWPTVLPQMLAGLRIGAAQALAACIIAEIYTAMTGLGGLIVGYGASFNMPRYFAVVATVLAIGSTTAFLLRRLEERFALP